MLSSFTWWSCYRYSLGHRDSNVLHSLLDVDSRILVIGWSLFCENNFRIMEQYHSRQLSLSFSNFFKHIKAKFKGCYPHLLYWNRDAHDSWCCHDQRVNRSGIQDESHRPDLSRRKSGVWCVWLYCAASYSAPYKLFWCAAGYHHTHYTL